METITKDQVANILNNLSLEAEIPFTCTFIKRTTGQPRTMKAVRHKREALHGGDSAYDHKANALIPVYDLEAQAWRSIPVDSVTELHIDGHDYQVS